MIFNVHGTVHLSNTSHINTNEMQLFYSVYLVLELYMFRTHFASIIRSTINCKIMMFRRVVRLALSSGNYV